MFSSLSIAASFDCQKASTFVENAICQDPALSALDDEMVAAFNAAIASSGSSVELKKQQHAWLRTIRNICQTNVCLEKAYQERILVLTHVGGSASSNLKGEYIRYNAHDKPDYDSASLTLTTAEKGKVKVTGSAVWVGDAKTGSVHIGEVDGIFELQGEQVNYKDGNGCEFVLLLGKNALTVNNDNGQCGGVNVSFNGYYKKVK
jgi:uncharacterized protein